MDYKGGRMDYFALAKGITNDYYTRQLLQDKRLADLEMLVAMQAKLIDEQRELIALLKAHLS